jgi:hypothetical protein
MRLSQLRLVGARGLDCFVERQDSRRGGQRQDG